MRLKKSDIQDKPDKPPKKYKKHRYIDEDSYRSYKERKERRRLEKEKRRKSKSKRRDEDFEIIMPESDNSSHSDKTLTQDEKDLLEEEFYDNSGSVNSPG